MIMIISSSIYSILLQAVNFNQKNSSSKHSHYSKSSSQGAKTTHSSRSTFDNDEAKAAKEYASQLKIQV